MSITHRCYVDPVVNPHFPPFRLLHLLVFAGSVNMHIFNNDNQLII